MGALPTFPLMSWLLTAQSIPLMRPPIVNTPLNDLSTVNPLSCRRQHTYQPCAPALDAFTHAPAVNYTCQHPTAHQWSTMLQARIRIEMSGLQGVCIACHVAAMLSSTMRCCGGMQHLRLVETPQDAMADDDVLSKQIARLPSTQIPDAQHIAATTHSSLFQCSHYIEEGVTSLTCLRSPVVWQLEVGLTWDRW
jgi:hypothetical protein